MSIQNKQVLHYGSPNGLVPTSTNYLLRSVTVNTLQLAACCLCVQKHCSQIPENSTHASFTLKYHMCITHARGPSGDHTLCFAHLSLLQCETHPRSLCFSSHHNPETLEKTRRVVSQDVLRRGRLLSSVMSTQHFVRLSYTDVFITLFERHFYFIGISPKERGAIFVCITCSVR